jgi:hypothetical protein
MRLRISQAVAERSRVSCAIKLKDKTDCKPFYILWLTVCFTKQWQWYQWPDRLRRNSVYTVKLNVLFIHCNSKNAIFNSFLVYKHLNRDSKLKYKAFVMNVARICATDKMVAAKRDPVRPGPSTPTPRRPHVDPPGRISGWNVET